jgi:hypothetical protein
MSMECANLLALCWAATCRSVRLSIVAEVRKAATSRSTPNNFVSAPSQALPSIPLRGRGSKKAELSHGRATVPFAQPAQVINSRYNRYCPEGFACFRIHASAGSRPCW